MNCDLGSRNQEQSVDSGRAARRHIQVNGVGCRLIARQPWAGASQAIALSGGREEPAPHRAEGRYMLPAMIR